MASKINTFVQPIKVDNSSNKNNRKPIDLYSETPIDDENTSNETNVYDDALAQALRDQNYKTFYNTAIQLYNMKNNSQKYLNNELAGQGLNSQGYGTSAHAGINNNAMNLYAEAQDKYNNTEDQITEDAYNRKIAKEEEIDNQLNYFLENAIAYGASEDVINKYLSNYGYMEAKEDKDGNITYEFTDKWNNLSDDRKAYLQSVLDGRTLEEEKVKTSEENNAFIGYRDEVKAENNAIYNISFYNGSGTNNNFNVTFGDNQYKLEMGAKIGEFNNRTGLSQEGAEQMYADKEAGDMWVHDNNGTLTIMMKDGNGDIRLVEYTAGNSNDLYEVGKALGINTEMYELHRRGAGVAFWIKK